MREKELSNGDYFTCKPYTAASLKIALKRIEQDLAKEKINSLDWCRKRGLSARIQYYLFCELETDHPQEAILYLYESLKIGFEPACKRFDNDYFLFQQDRTFAEEEMKDKTAQELFILGLLAYAGVARPSNYALAMECFKRVVNLEPRNWEAHNNLGILRGILNVDKTSERFQLAAENGNPAAQYNHGTMYQIGFEVSKNVEEAIKWCRRAAAQGYAPAQRNLAVISIEKEIDVQQNPLDLLHLAAEQEDRFAQLILSRYYKNGAHQININILPKVRVETLINVEESLKWSKRVAMGGVDQDTSWQIVDFYRRFQVEINTAEVAKWARSFNRSECRRWNICYLWEKEPSLHFTARYHDSLWVKPKKENILILIRENREAFLALLRVDDFITQKHLFETITIISSESSQEQLSFLLIEFSPYLYHLQMIELLQKCASLPIIYSANPDSNEDYLNNLVAMLTDKVVESESLLSENVFDEKERLAIAKLSYFILVFALMALKESKSQYGRDFASLSVKLILVKLSYISVDNKIEDIGGILSSINLDKMQALISEIFSITGLKTLQSTLEEMLLPNSRLINANTRRENSYSGLLFKKIMPIEYDGSKAKNLTLEQDFN